MSEVLPNDVCDIVPGTGRRSIRRQDDGIPVLGLLPSVSGNVVEPGFNTTKRDANFRQRPGRPVCLNRSPSEADKHCNDLLCRACP